MYLNAGYRLWSSTDNNRNKANKQQRINFDKNQAKQATESQITCCKGELYSKQLFYVVHLQCDPFRSWFLHDLCHF